jgi:hypothetical protein
VASERYETRATGESGFSIFDSQRGEIAEQIDDLACRALIAAANRAESLARRVEDAETELIRAVGHCEEACLAERRALDRVEELEKSNQYFAACVRRYLQWREDKSPYTQAYCLDKVWTQLRAIEDEAAALAAKEGA